MIKHPLKRAILFVLGISAILGILYLFAIRPQITRSRHYTQLLDEAEWMNQHDSLFTTDSVMLRVARHYDHWWHPRNLRMKAYYFLGCTYRDLGEAPAAIHYYNIAAEQADTTSNNCDYSTLFRIYGQMAALYAQQSMPQEEREMLAKYRKYALQAGDTLNYIVGIEHEVIPSYMMDDTLGVFAYTDSASVLYRQYGNEQLAASVYPTAIYVSLLNKNYSRARRYMDVFENASGLFDEEGNITSERELYYYSKGLYSFGTGQIDSAEYWFRRLLKYGYTLEANKGLLSVYQTEGNSDSVIKYSILAEESLLQWETKRQANAIIQSTAMYKYERNQSIALHKAEEARTAWLLLILSFMLLFSLIGISFAIFRKLVERKKQKEQALLELGEKYNRNRDEYLQLRDELGFLQRSFAALQESSSEEVAYIKDETYQKLEEKQQEINHLTAILNENRREIQEREEELLSSEIATLFHRMAEGKLNGRMPSKKDWEGLIRQYKRNMPHMYALMRDASLSQQEMKTAILTHLDFTVKSISSLFETSIQNVSKAKSHANYKLFHQETGAPSLYPNLRKCARLHMNI